MKKLGFVLLLALALMTMVACNNDKEKDLNENGGKSDQPLELKDVTVVLDWTPNTNHTGLYVALENGYFEEQGLNVEIIQPEGVATDTLVAVGQAEFGVSYQESVTYARLQDVPVVSIAAVIQHNTSGFASLASKGMKTAQDFEGKSYGGWGMPIENAMIKAFMESEGADPSKVEIITTGTVDFFTSSETGVDFAWVYEGWDLVQARLTGVDIDYIEFKSWDPALDYYTPVLITSEDLIEKDPELVEAFMKAVTMGYEFAIQSPEEAGRILLKQVPELDEALVLSSAEFLAKEYQADADQWGHQKESVWTNYQNWLYERELIEGLIDVDKAFTNEFLPKED